MDLSLLLDIYCLNNLIMKLSFLLYFSFILLMACNNASLSTQPEELPAGPASKSVVVGHLKGHSFSMVKTGALSPFELDKKNPVEWFKEGEDTTRFFREFHADLMKTSFRFGTDSSVSFNNEGKMVEGKWWVDTLFEEGSTPGMRLRISYADSNSSFALPGATGPMEMTYSYLIMGADEKGLLLELPREFNRRKIVGWFRSN